MNRQCEGWLGEDYIRIYAEGDRSRIVDAYLFGDYLPGYTLLGSWGFDALCVGPDFRLYRIPWIPLGEELKRECYPSLDAFVADMARFCEAEPSYEYFGKESHFVTPIVFGGSPSQKIMMIDQQAHARFCCFWNGVYLRVRKGGGKPDVPSNPMC